MSTLHTRGAGRRIASTTSSTEPASPAWTSTCPGPFALPVWFALGLLAFADIAAAQQAGTPAPRPAAVKPAFPPGTLAGPEQLPPGRLRSQLDALPQSTRERAIRWLGSFHFTQQDLSSLHADSSGGILYACTLSGPVSPLPIDIPVIEEASVPVDPFPAGLEFHSRPGAPNVLFLNFCGEAVSNTQWNLEVSRTVIPAVAFSVDSDLATFSDAEQVMIRRIWQRIAEDYAPFDIDVTTERPASLTTRTAMALITRTTDALGELNPYATSGGVAYVNVFGTSTYATYRPAWIYHDNLANEESFIAEAASHEVGHNMGLSHDGRTDGTEYYGGHGSGDISWGPLMGTGYYRNVSHWSKGEYYLANNTQDDLATLAGKLAYRADDHGGTPGTASALVLTGGTNIVATTPENDPANTQAANKGVLERNTDVDLFSFVTGDGPISLAINPWLMPAGTRGGNVDMLAELRDEAGNLLLSSNPPEQTTALLETNLAQGRYYLHVKSSAAGDPFNTSPAGYTVYGSLGQYFITGYITQPTAWIVPPVAELAITDIVESRQATNFFTVTYSDDASIDVSTIDSGDIRVTGPNGYSQAAQFIALNNTTAGTPRTATYGVAPPGDVWLPADNGVYALWMQANQVGDTEGGFVGAGLLGEFHVAVPVALYTATMDSDPGWVLDPEWEYGVPTYASNGPTSGYTGARIVGYNLTGDYASRLTPKYATTPAFNCTGATSLDLRFKRWLRTRPNDPAAIQVSTNGTSWLDVWVSSSTVADSAWTEVRYALPAEVVGSPTVRLRWSLASNQMQTDIGWNIDDVEVLANGALDTTPPVPALSTANLTLAGSPSHSCSVTFTDATAVRVSSLDAADLLVLGPDGGSNLVEFVGADLPGDGSPITATYAVLAPGGTWDAADNGLYTIALQDAAVEDTLNNAVAQQILGTFTVSISTVEPGMLEISPPEGLVASGPVGGPFTPSSVLYTLTNSGGTALSWMATWTADWIALSAPGGILEAGASTTVAVSLSGAAGVLEAGDYVDTLLFVNTSTGKGSSGRLVSLTVAGSGGLVVWPESDFASSGPAGGPFQPASMSFTLTNAGGTTLDWAAAATQEWLSLSATAGTLTPGGSTSVSITLNANAGSLAAGTYSGTVTFANIAGTGGNASRQVNLVVQGAEPAPLALPPVWRWSNPMPHGANVVDQATIGPVSVQVGERGQVFTSDDWGLWWPRDSHTTASLRAATFFGGRLVLTGEAGTVAFADRLDQLYLLDLGTPDWLEGVASSTSRVVAVGDHAAVYTSTNAVVWHRVSGLPFTNWLRSVAYGSNQFVAVGEQGLIATSNNGSTWQVRSSGTTTNLNRITWVGDHFLVAGDGGTLLTNDTSGAWFKVSSGTTNHLYGAAGTPGSEVADGNLEVRLSENAGPWASQLSSALPFPAPEWTYYSALANSDYYLLSGRTGMNVEGVRTNEGVQWQPTAASIRTWLWSVARTPSHYVAVGDYGTILSSPNGIDWDFELVPASATNAILLGVGGSSNLLLAVGSQGTILWGTNTYVWHPLVAPTANDLQGVCFDDQQFIITGGNGTILTSPTGTNWTARSTPTSAFLMSATAFAGGLVAVGEQGTILTSTNHGTNWTQRASGTTNWLSQVRWLHDRLVAVGENGTILTSLNGVQWQPTSSGTTAWLNAAEHLDGAWLVAGNQGTVLASPDATNWYSFGTLTRKSLYGATLHAGQFIVVGAEGVIVRSQLLPVPTPVQLAGFSRNAGINVFLFAGVPDQRFALESSTDLTSWSDESLLEILDGSGTLVWVSEGDTNAPPANFYRTRLLP